MKLGLRRASQQHHRLHDDAAHHYHHDNVLHGLPRLITWCTPPCLRQPHSLDGSLDLGSQGRLRGSLLAEDGPEEDNLEERLSMFGGAERQEPEDAVASGAAAAEQNNARPGAIPGDTSCRTNNSDHSSPLAALGQEHAQRPADANATRNYSDQMDQGRGPGSSLSDWQDFFPQAALRDDGRRRWRRPDSRAGRDNTATHNTRERNAARRRAPLFGLQKNGMPLVGHRSLFDPSLWEPLLGGADLSPDPVSGNLVPHGNGDGASDLDVRLSGDTTGGATSGENDTANFLRNDDHSNNNAVIDIAGTTDQESADNLSQISYFAPGSSTSSSNLDLNALLQSLESLTVTQQYSLSAPAACQDATEGHPNNTQPTTNAGSIGHRHEWYFYDPRLMPESTADNVAIGSYFGGIPNQMSLPDILGPPAYEDVVGNEVTGLETVATATTPNNWMLGSPAVATHLLSVPDDPPPPYCEFPPPYEQTVPGDEAEPSQSGNALTDPLLRQVDLASSNRGRMMNFNHFRFSSLQDSPLMSHLAAISNNTVSYTLGEDNLDIDLDLMEVQGQPYNDRESSDHLWEDSDDGMDDGDQETESPFDPENPGEWDAEAHQRLFTNPVGFLPGQRPAVRWSTGMGLDRWTSSQNWVMYGTQI